MDNLTEKEVFEDFLIYFDIPNLISYYCTLVVGHPFCIWSPEKISNAISKKLCNTYNNVLFTFF